MHRTHQFKKLAFFAVASLASLWTSAQAASSFRIVDLGTLQGNTYSSAESINSLGQIAGSVGGGNTISRASVWSNGSWMPLGDSSSVEYSHALDINEAGAVVGVYSDGNNQNGAQWSNGAFIPLEWQSCCTGTQAKLNAINASGNAVGRTDFNGAIRTNSGLITQQLPSTEGTTRTTASDINDFGQVVGSDGDYLFNGGFNLQAISWGAEGSRHLGTANGFDYSFANSVNNTGEVVGSSFSGIYADMGHATYWHNGQILDLGSLSPERGSNALAINNNGQIVGQDLAVTNGVPQAMYWDNSTSNPISLLSLVDDADPLKSVTYLRSAKSINDNGMIVGDAIISGNYRGFLLLPIASVPETQTWVMMLFGFSLLITWSRAKRHSHTPLA